MPPIGESHRKSSKTCLACLTYIAHGTHADAMDQGLMQVLGEMTPRQYVALQTMSPFEIGYRLKQLLRDELFERRRDARQGQQNG